MYTSSGVKGASFTANTVLIDGVWQTKKRFAKEWAEAEKATQQAEKTEHDLNATKLDVEKVKNRSFPSTRRPCFGGLYCTSSTWFTRLLRFYLFPPLPPHFPPEGQAPRPRPDAHGRGEQERLRVAAAEVQQGAELLLLHGDTADLQREIFKRDSTQGGRSMGGGWNLRSRLDVCAIRKCRRWKSRGFGTW